MSSPKRVTRSGSLSSASNVDEIKKMIAESRDFVVSQIGDELRLVKDQLSTFSSRIDAIEEAIKNIQSENLSLRSEISSLRNRTSNYENSKIEIMDASLMEFENRSFRRNNLIIRGVEEKDDGALEERRLHDEATVQDVFLDIGITDAEPVECRRIGKKRNGPRMLKVKLGDVEEKMTILRKSKNLRNSSKYKDVYINPDLTPLQQDQEKKLRSELKERKQRGEDVILYRGRVHTLSDLQDFRNRVL